MVIANSMVETELKSSRPVDPFGILDGLKDAVFVTTETEICYFNTAFMKLMRIDQGEDCPGLSDLISRIHPDDRRGLIDYWRALLDDRSKTPSPEYRFLKDDGEFMWIRPLTSLSEIDGTSYFINIIHDVTAEKVQTIEREWTEHLFKTVFRIAPDFMTLSKLPSSEIIEINPTFLNLFGFRRDDVLGKSFADFDIWTDPMFPQRFSEELKLTSSMNDIPTTVKVRGGVIRHIRLSAQKIDLGGQVLLLTVGRDVSEELLQAQELQRSRDTAELANRAKSEFLANMSHELRTPLNAILGFAEILKDELLGPIGSERYKGYAGDIYDSGSHLLAIINDILDLSKVESGRLEAHLKWIEPYDAILGSLSLVSQRAMQAGLSIRHTISEEVEIEADERLVKQICLNLLSNAIKFTNPGGRVELKLGKTGNGGAFLSVEDTGIGMSPEEIKIAKRPFGQVDSSLSRAHEGSGLGLPLVTAFAEKLKATMVIDSTPGIGTRVRVVFPPEKIRYSEAE